MSKIGKFYGIGVGPGVPELLTLAAVNVLSKVDVVFEAVGVNSKESVSGKVVNSVESCDAKKIQLVFSMSLDYDEREKFWCDAAEKVVAELRNGSDCAFVTIGDPLIYSTYIYLLRKVQAILPNVEVETIPGITSFQAAAAKNNYPIVEDTEKLCIVPAFSNDQIENKAVAEVADSLVLMKIYRNRENIVEFSEQESYNGVGLYAQRIGLDGEVITEDFEKLKSIPEEYLSLMILKKNKES